MKHRATPILIITAILLGGCVFAPGGGGWDDDDYDDDGRVLPTLGQELLDLDRAHDAGVISDTEYENAKERILDR